MGYRKTYFRIDSLYRYGAGWPGDGAAEAFRDETRELFQANGWTLRPGNERGVCDTVAKGQQDLYLHPMNFSGVIQEEEIPGIKAFLALGITFHCRGVDCYEPYLELNDGEYRALLESRQEEIAGAILERFATKRRNLYHVNPGILSLAEQFSVRRLCDKEWVHDLSYSYVAELVERMIRDGRLVTAKVKSGIGIRAATAGELSRRASPKREAPDAGQLSL